jgi:chemosensory pili system protein ChpE
LLQSGSDSMGEIDRN